MSARVRWLAAALGVSFVACGRSELSLGPGDAGSGGVDSANTGTGGVGPGGSAAAGRGGSAPSGAGGSLGGTSSAGIGGTSRGGTSGSGTSRSGTSGSGTSSFGGASGSGASRGGTSSFGGAAGASSPAGAGGMTQSCGNGIVEGAEECDQVPSDDGNCVRCHLARCGDGNVWPGHEDCDDKGLVSGDGCSAMCQYETRSVHAGAQFTCAVSLGGEIKCWGDATTGSLGLGDAVDRGAGPGGFGKALPSVDLGDRQAATSLSVGSHVCAVVDERVKCWGYNGDGELGLGDFLNRGDSPDEMGDELPWVELGVAFRAVDVAAGFDASCAIDVSGGVKCWGSNLYGQLGVGDMLSRGGDASDMGDALPYVNLGGYYDAVSVAVGWHHVCVLLDNAQVKCWGSNSSGQLGLGDQTNRGNAPTDLGDALPFVNLGTDAAVVKLATNANRTCAILTDGRLKCWGDNSGGQLGFEDKVSRGVAPEQMGDDLPAVDLGAGIAVIDVALGVDHTCALLEDGRVKCWGLNTDGVLGSADLVDVGGNAGDMGENLSGVQLDVDAEVVSISAGTAHTCALFANHQVKCWGRGDRGALGLGDTQNRGDDPDEMGAALPFVDVVF